MTPLIIEVAVNGSRTKRENAHVPLSDAELIDCIDRCVAAGASIVHLHAGEAVVGAGARHAPEPYERVLAEVARRHPDLLVYPTLPGGGAGTSMQDRFAHVEALARAGLLRLAPVDPGTMNYGGLGPAGEPPVGDRVYQTTFADAAYGFAACVRHGIGCTMSLFEPGFLQLALAHRRAGSLPRASIVKFEFTTGRRLLFGLPPGAASLDAWCAMLDDAPLPWMVALRDGDVAQALAGLAIARGGHVRVGLEDYAGAREPSNEALVAEVAALGARHGRRAATPSEAAGLIGIAMRRD